MNPSDTTSTSRRLFAESAAVRVNAIRARMSLAFTLCSLAENEVVIAQGGAEKTLLKVQHTIEEVRQHLNEPGHVPAGAMDELRLMLAELEKRAQHVKRVE